MRRAVFLDRDGVLNNVKRDAAGITHPPSSLEELVILPGVHQACLRLRETGYFLIVVTNQPDVARGTQTRENVEQINSTLQKLLKLDQVLTCYHDNSDHCNCRKPKPGLLLSAANLLNIDIASSYMVGDRPSDILAGQAVGCKTILVDPYKDYVSTKTCKPDHLVCSLLEASEIISGS